MQTREDRELLTEGPLSQLYELWQVRPAPRMCNLPKKIRFNQLSCTIKYMITARFILTSHEIDAFCSFPRSHDPLRLSVQYIFGQWVPRRRR